MTPDYWILLGSHFEEGARNFKESEFPMCRRYNLVMHHCSWLLLLKSTALGYSQALSLVFLWRITPMLLESKGLPNSTYPAPRDHCDCS